ncbi:MAG: polysaccharide deacetylase family protein [Capnocytophaga sp.]|nr:polysaccharide deacetylase family protein [Capnocytophaga sp.]
MVIIVILFVGFIAWGVFDIRLSYFTPTMYCLNGRPYKTVALSFDDGATELTPRFLDLLKKYNAKAIFFCIGKQIEKYPEVIKRINEEGHIIGNHTFTHYSKNCFASAKIIAEEIKTTDAALAKLNITTQLFRPPYGITNPSIARAIKLMNKKTIGWDIRSLDTVIKNEDRLFKRIISKLSHGNIILMHDTSERSLNVLERLLQHLLENDYKITNNLAIN